ATYIWRVYPREQEGYYTAFFHANNSSVFNNQYQYYGFHPYPYPTFPPPPGTTAVQEWEISVAGGYDITGSPVVFNRWYQQVAVVSKIIGAVKDSARYTFYWDWPDTTHKIAWVDSIFTN